MPYMIQDPEAEKMLEALAAARRQSKPEIIRAALGQLLVEQTKQSLWDRTADLRARIAP